MSGWTAIRGIQKNKAKGQCPLSLLFCRRTYVKVKIALEAVSPSRRMWKHIRRPLPLRRLVSDFCFAGSFLRQKLFQIGVSFQVFQRFLGHLAFAAVAELFRRFGEREPIGAADLATHVLSDLADLAGLVCRQK